MAEGPRSTQDGSTKPNSPRTFLVVSLIVAFPLLVLAFAQILSVFVVRPLTLMMPPPPGLQWLVTATVWLLAAVAAVSVCRMVAGRTSRKRNRPSA